MKQISRNPAKGSLPPFHWAVSLDGMWAIYRAERISPSSDLSTATSGDLHREMAAAPGHEVTIVSPVGPEDRWPNSGSRGQPAAPMTATRGPR